MKGTDDPQATSVRANAEHGLKFWMDGLDMLSMCLPAVIVCFFALFAAHLLQQRRGDWDQDMAPIAPTTSGPRRPRWTTRTVKYELATELEPATDDAPRFSFAAGSQELTPSRADTVSVARRKPLTL
jgi:hypothetical protein